MQTASCSSGACPALAAPCLCFDIPPGNSNFTCGQEARSCSPATYPPRSPPLTVSGTILHLSQVPAAWMFGLALRTAHGDMHLFDGAWSTCRQARRSAPTWETHVTSRPHAVGRMDSLRCSPQPGASHVICRMRGPLARTQSMRGLRCARASAVPARPRAGSLAPGVQRELPGGGHVRHQLRALHALRRLRLLPLLPGRAAGRDQLHLRAAGARRAQEAQLHHAV